MFRKHIKNKKIFKLTFISYLIALITMFFIELYHVEKEYEYTEKKEKAVFNAHTKDAADVIQSLDKKNMYQFKYLLEPSNIWVKADFLFPRSKEAKLLIGDVCQYKNEILLKNVQNHLGKVFIYTCIPKDTGMVLIYHGEIDYNNAFSVHNLNLFKKSYIDKSKLIKRFFYLSIFFIFIFYLACNRKGVVKKNMKLLRQASDQVVVLENLICEVYSKMVARDLLSDASNSPKKLLSTENAIAMISSVVERFCEVKKIDFKIQADDKEEEIDFSIIDLTIFLILRRIPLIERGGGLEVSFYLSEISYEIEIKDSGFYVENEEKRHEKYLNHLARNSRFKLSVSLQKRKEFLKCIQTVRIRREDQKQSDTNIVPIRGKK